MSKFNLSDKELSVNDCRKAINQKIYFKENVKEFIKKINEIPMERLEGDEIKKIINNYAGDKFISNKQEVKKDGE